MTLRYICEHPAAQIVHLLKFEAARRDRPLGQAVQSVVGLESWSSVPSSHAVQGWSLLQDTVSLILLNTSGTGFPVLIQSQIHLRSLCSS